MLWIPPNRYGAYCSIPELDTIIKFVKLLRILINLLSRSRIRVVPHGTRLGVVVSGVGVQVAQVLGCVFSDT